MLFSPDTFAIRITGRNGEAMNANVTEIASQLSRSFNGKTHLLPKHLSSIKYFKTLGFSAYMCWWRNGFGELREYWRKARVCQTLSWQRFCWGLLQLAAGWRPFIYLIYWQQCYITSSGIKLKDIWMLLGCGPVKGAEDLMCLSSVFPRTLNNSFPLAPKANGSDGWKY